MAFANRKPYDRPRWRGVPETATKVWSGAAGRAVSGGRGWSAADTGQATFAAAQPPATAALRNVRRFTAFKSPASASGRRSQGGRLVDLSICFWPQPASPVAQQTIVSKHMIASETKRSQHAQAAGRPTLATISADCRFSTDRGVTVRYFRGVSFQLAVERGIASWKLTPLVSRTVFTAARRSVTLSAWHEPSRRQQWERSRRSDRF